MEKYKVSINLNGKEQTSETTNVAETLKMLWITAMSGFKVSNVTFYKN